MALTVEDLLRELDSDEYVADIEDKLAVETYVSGKPDEIATEVEQDLEYIRNADNFKTTARRASYIVNARVAAAKRASEIRKQAAKDAGALTELVSRKQLNELIRVITEPDTIKIAELLRLMNAHTTRALRLLMPVRVRNIYIELQQQGNNTTMPRTPGFMFVADHSLGPAFDIWLNPDIPCYFPQFSEQALIKSEKPYDYNLITKAILRYKKILEKRSKMEMYLARRLFSVVTRYDLLLANAEYYELYMERRLYEIN